MRPATCASLSMLVIAALLVPALATASWDPLYRTYLTFAAGEVGPEGRVGMASEAATGDFNGDGLPDIVVTSLPSNLVGGDTGTTVSVLLHSGSPGYPPMYQPWQTVVAADPSATPFDIAVADLNGDAKKDILTSNIPHFGEAWSISVLYGTGTGQFRPFKTKVPPEFQGEFAVGDLNNDGRADVACLVGTGGGNNGVAVMLSTPDSLGAPVIYASGPGRTKLAIGDVTTDGVPDVVVAYLNSVLILVGDNTGAFEWTVDPIPATDTASEMSIVSLNGDAYADIVQLRYDPFNAVVLMGTGFGGFESPVEIPLGPPMLNTTRNLLTGDVDRDGDIDLVGYSTSPGDIAVFKNNGSGSFGPATHWAGITQSGAPAPLTDVNQDGWLDLVAGDYYPDYSNSVAVVLNDGTGGFITGVKAIDAVNPTTEALGDFNRDGKLDIAVADSQRITLGLGNGDGTFTASGFLDSGFGPDIILTADINRDGKLDLVAQVSNAIKIYPGVGDGTFSLPQTVSAVWLTPHSVAELNLDGRPDLILYTATQFRVYLQQADGTYGPSSAYTPAVGLNSFSVGDWNRDGAPDVAVAGMSGLSIFPGSPTALGTLGAEVVVATGTTYQEVCAIDSNRDGAPDLAGRLRFNFGDLKSGINLFFGNGSGGFSAPVPHGVLSTIGQSIDSWDANRDGIPDLITKGKDLQGYGHLHAEILLGGTSGTFALRSSHGLGIPALTRATFGDLNGDAMPDFVLASLTMDSDVDPEQTAERSVLAAPPAKGSSLRQATFYPGISTAFVAVGDVNRDGKPDVVTGTNGASPGIAVLLGNGNGGLGASTTLTQSRYGHKVSLADFNRDGILDIAAWDIEVGSERIATFLGVGNGTFGARNDFAIATGLDFDIGDMNRDGKLDIVASSSTSVRVLLGTGLGTFVSGASSPTSATVNDLDLADLNRDGSLDVVMAAGNVKVMYGNLAGGLGAAVDIAAPLTDCQNVAVADVNRDGVPDIIANNGATYYVIWGSLSAAPSTYTTANLGYGALDMKVGEAEADGKPFLFLTRNADGLEVFRLSPTGAFTQVGSHLIGQGAYQLALADMDRDGQVDVVCPGNFNSVSVNLHGFSTVTGVEVPATAPAAPRVSLRQNYPNPFNPSTTIHYTLSRADRVQLRVFDVRGRLVTTLRDGSEPAGERRVEWDGRDRSGQPVASGVYLYRLTTGSGEIRSKRMVVAK